jgi:hypothetical protein
LRRYATLARQRLSLARPRLSASCPGHAAAPQAPSTSVLAARSMLLLQPAVRLRPLPPLWLACSQSSPSSPKTGSVLLHKHWGCLSLSHRIAVSKVICSFTNIP